MEKGFFHPTRGYWQTIDEPSADEIAAHPVGTIEVPIKPGADFEWRNGKWVFVEPPAPVIITATAASMRLALLEAGRLDDVEAIVATNKAAQIEWQFRQTYRREHAIIKALQGPAGFSDQMIDALFKRAAEIEAGR